MIALLLFSAFATSIDEVRRPPAGAWISDGADVLGPGHEAALNTKLEALHQDLGAEVVLVTLGSIGDEVPKPFATGLFNEWKLGDREANNGLLILMVMDQRRLEMETGYGLENVLTDGWLGSLQAREMVPRFKQGDFGDGLAEGLIAIERKLRQHPDEVREGTRGAIDVDSTSESSLSTVIGVSAGGLAAGGFGIWGVGALRRAHRRRRTCEKCELYMPMLDEAADDEHLTEGQQMEEAIGSIDWQVHQCPQCSDLRTFSSNKWFSGYSQCPQCSNKTRSSTTTTVRSATYTSGGLVRISERCAHCTFTNTYTRSTPRRTRSTSSGSSGGSSGGSSSFGGGSSGGGGAGSSW